MLIRAGPTEEFPGSDVRQLAIVVIYTQMAQQWKICVSERDPLMTERGFRLSAMSMNEKKALCEELVKRLEWAGTDSIVLA